MNANEFQEAVGARASNAFPNATVHSICARMRDEITQITVAENQEALYRACAEVATQLTHIAHIEKFSLWAAMRDMFVPPYVETSQRRPDDSEYRNQISELEQKLQTTKEFASRINDRLRQTEQVGFELSKRISDLEAAMALQKET